jgi:cellulose synthase/poly-beta-1,6-N-acetylglucosamine synthase-like glycosyltransferase
MTMRHWALLGGIGPGIFLGQQAWLLLSAAIGWFRLHRGRRTAFAPALAVLVPAHNEAHGIAATIAALDAAAATYAGAVRVYVIDNASRDETAHEARRALEHATRLTGDVLSCPTPGKAVALNHGLAHVEEDFVVRIDADTEIGPGCLDIAMRHFTDPRVGAVGGLPLPRTHRGWIARARLVEVLQRHGFVQVALGAFGAVTGVPGMFAVYRMAAVHAVGGTVQGMNGEDTDLCLRMGSIGYRTVADPKAVYVSETPVDYAHLREQRTRWFRSIYHLGAHNRHLLGRPRSVVGAVVLPFMLASAARRAMLAPLLVFAALLYAAFRGEYALLPWQPVAAMVVGMPMLVAVTVLVTWRRPGALLSVPTYLVFRLLRSFFTLGAALSLVYPPLAGRGAGRSAERSRVVVPDVRALGPITDEDAA